MFEHIYWKPNIMADKLGVNYFEYVENQEDEKVNVMNSQRT